MIHYTCDICDYTSNRLDRIKKHVSIHKKHEDGKRKIEKEIKKVYNSIVATKSLEYLDKDSLFNYFSIFFQNIGFSIKNVHAMNVLSPRKIYSRSDNIKPEDTSVFISVDVSRNERPSWLSEDFKKKLKKERSNIFSDPFSVNLNNVNISAYLYDIAYIPLHDYKCMHIQNIETKFDKSKETFIIKAKIELSLRKFETFCKKFNEAILLNQKVNNAYDSVLSAAYAKSKEYIAQNIISNISIYDKYDKLKQVSNELENLENVRKVLSEELCDIGKGLAVQLAEECIDEYAKNNNFNLASTTQLELKTAMANVGCESTIYSDCKTRIIENIVNKKQIIKLDLLE